MTLQTVRGFSQAQLAKHAYSESMADDNSPWCGLIF